MDAVDGFLIYHSRHHSIYTCVIKLLQYKYPHIFSGALVALYCYRAYAAGHFIPLLLY